MTLDYRTPRTGQPRVQRVLSELEKDEAVGSLTIAGKILLGLILSLVVPVLLAGDFTRRWFSNASVSDHLFAFVLAFLVTTLGLFLFSMWLARRTQPDFALDSIRGEGRASSRGEFEFQRYKILILFWTEIAMLGPNLIWNVYDTLRGRTNVSQVARVVAASIVVDLLDADQAIAVRQLVQPNRQPCDLVPAIKYLAQRDWIDIAKARDRVWLRSPIRKRLADLQ